MTETIVMRENLACVGESNYSSTFLEGLASIFTRQALTSTATTELEF
jgi:hypothetical protein